MMNKRVRSLIDSLWQDVRRTEPEVQSIDKHVYAAINWIFESQDATGSGGSAACYNLILGWEPPYPETSGYIVPTLFDVANQYNMPEAESRAKKMAEWLLSVQLPNGAFPAGTYSGTAQDPSVFNTGQILRGLTRAYLETNDDKYRECARSAIDWLADAQASDGSWSVHDYNSLSHAYSSRISWPVLEAVHKLNLDTGTEVASRNLRWVLNQQTETGWFDKCSFERGDDPYLHTIAYTIRGLLESAKYLDGDRSEQCNHAAIYSANCLLNKQEKNGYLFGTYDANWSATADYYCLTGNAQMAIVWSRLFEQSGDRKYANRVAETVKHLCASQTLSGPETILGGMRGSDPVWGRYMYLRYPNWASKFFIDALLAMQHLNGE